MTVSRPEGSTPNSMAAALETAGVQATATPGATARPAAQPAAAAARTNRSTPRGSSLMDINSRFRRPISRNSAGEVTSALLKAIQKQFDDTMSDSFRDAYSIHTLDNNTNMIALSSILLCFNVQDKGADHVIVYQLIIEGSSGKLNNRFISLGNQTIEIDTVAGDVADRTLWDKVVTFLTETFGNKAITFHNAGVMALPTELSSEDSEHIHRITFNAVQALYTVAENDILGAEGTLSVSMVDQGTTLSANLDYNPAECDNAVGLPVRSNISVSLRGSMNTGNQSPHEQVRELTRVDGYIDLIYSEPAQQAYGQAPVTQRYHPRFVITRLDSEVDAVTPELQLLALSTTTLLSRGMAWSGVFQQRYGVAGADLRDIGAIGFELNLQGDPNAKPERIDTKSESFGKPQLWQLVSMAIHDGLLYSMDIEEVGELAWLHQTFLAAANNDVNAYKAIIEAANNLSDGHFERIWQGGAIAVDDQNRVHLGYYVDSNGQRKDIRDIDYLALLNLLGEKDMGTVVNWSQSFDNVQAPLEMRLETRAKILKALLPEARIKGYARRITFTSDFITALQQACANAGLVIRPNNLTMIEGQGGRGTYNASAFAVNGQQAGGLFNYNAPQFGGGYRGINSPFLTRYTN